MTIGEAVRLGIQQLAQVPDPQIDAELLLADILGMNRLQLKLHTSQGLTVEQEQAYLSMLSLRASRRPLQYILGNQCFYGCEMQVNESVLIPRPETEILCEQVLRSIESIPNPLVADICTGSGAIAVTIKKNRPDAQVVATELSVDALKVARQNALGNGTQITFLQGDLLKPLMDTGFDVIASNPPYIQTAQLASLQPEVQREPRMALDGGGDGLVFYRRLAKEAPPYLKHGGKLFLELGDGQAEDVAGIMAAAKQFETIRLHKDLSGHRRVLEAVRSSLL